MTMDAARSLAVQLVLSPTHRVGERCGFRILLCVVLLQDDDALCAPGQVHGPPRWELGGPIIQTLLASGHD